MSFTIKKCDGLSDKEIIRLSLQEVDYFACLYLKYEEKLLRYIKHISQCNHAEAEDILQEAFIKIWRNILSYDPGLIFESWLFRIVHNETISFWRKKTSFQKDKKLELNDEKLTLMATTAEFENVDEEKNVHLFIDKILFMLKQEYREVLVLKFFEDKSYEEISDILKIPEGTVATRINRAKKSFKALSGGKMDREIFNI